MEEDKISTYTVTEIVEAMCRPDRLREIREEVKENGRRLEYFYDLLLQKARLYLAEVEKDFF